jgi:hypothetical protein
MLQRKAAETVESFLADVVFHAFGIAAGDFRADPEHQ